jgi:hypothetical protein
VKRIGEANSPFVKRIGEANSPLANKDSLSRGNLFYFSLGNVHDTDFGGKGGWLE